MAGREHPDRDVYDYNGLREPGAVRRRDSEIGPARVIIDRRRAGDYVPPARTAAPSTAVARLWWGVAKW
jgi:hypothetical protein